MFALKSRWFNATRKKSNKAIALLRPRLFLEKKKKCTYSVNEFDRGHQGYFRDIFPRQSDLARASMI